MKDSIIISIIASTAVAAVAIAVPFVMPHNSPAPAAVVQTTTPTTKPFDVNSQLLTMPNGSQITLAEYDAHNEKLNDTLRAADQAIIQTQEDTIKRLQARLYTLEHPSEGVPELQFQDIQEYGPGGRMSYAVKVTNAKEKSFTITKARFNDEHEAYIGDLLGPMSGRPNPLFVVHGSIDNLNLTLGGYVYLYRYSDVQPGTNDYRNDIEFIDITSSDGATYRYTKSQFGEWKGTIKP